MTPLTLRRLTVAERGLAQEMFGADLATERVLILALPVWRRPFVAGPRLMVWPAADAVADFGSVSLRAQSIFVHELTHIWQAQHGVFLPLAKLRAGDGRAAYDYDLVSGPPFEAMNIEQQAMVVEHAFLAGRGVEAPFPAHLYVEIGSEWRGA